jgi:hypothetical protein
MLNDVYTTFYCRWKHYIDHHIHLVNSFVDEHDHEHDLHGEWAYPDTIWPVRR